MSSSAPVVTTGSGGGSGIPSGVRHEASWIWSGATSPVSTRGRIQGPQVCPDTSTGVGHCDDSIPAYAALFAASLVLLCANSTGAIYSRRMQAGIMQFFSYELTSNVIILPIVALIAAPRLTLDTSLSDYHTRLSKHS